jgi:hypothetical protein
MSHQPLINRIVFQLQENKKLSVTVSTSFKNTYSANADALQLTKKIITAKQALDCFYGWAKKTVKKEVAFGFVQDPTAVSQRFGVDLQSVDGTHVGFSTTFVGTYKDEERLIYWLMEGLAENRFKKPYPHSSSFTVLNEQGQVWKSITNE